MVSLISIGSSHSSVLSIAPSNDRETRVLTVFTNFPEFPMELQLKIWEFATGPITRYARMQEVLDSAFGEWCRNFDRENIRYQGEIDLPVTLRVCRASRKAALTLRKFPLMFSEIMDVPIPFDTNHDVLELNPGPLL